MCLLSQKHPVKEKVKLSKGVVRKQKDPKFQEAGKKAAETRRKREEEASQSMSKNKTADKPSTPKEEKPEKQEKEPETSEWHSTAISKATLKVQYNPSKRITASSMDDFVEKSWVEKYRPDSLSQCIGPIVPLLKAYVKTGSMPATFVFYGKYGTGKTTCARALCRDFYVMRGLFHKDATFRDVTSASNITREYRGIFPPVLCIDASKFKGSDSLVLEEVKGRVSNFMRYSVGKWPKFVDIEEADRFGFAVQDSISSNIEAHPNTRIIWTTNFLDAIRDRIISRAAGGVIEFVKPDEKELAKHLAGIAKAERVRMEESDIMEIAKKSPSVRDAVGMLQQRAVMIRCEER